jgi:ligand-binding sensor domain-containing protein
VAKPTMLYAHKELKMDEEGNIFLLLQGETILTWNESRNEFSTEYNFISLTDSMKVNDFIQQPGTRKYWISTSQGLAIYNRATDRLSYSVFNRENEAAIDAFKDLGITGHFFFDSRNRLWFDTWVSGMPTVSAFNTRSNKFEVLRDSYLDEIRSYYEVHGFFEQSDGTLWIMGLGLLGSLNETTKKFELLQNGSKNNGNINYDAVQELYEDREENVWIATRNSGLYRFNPSHNFFINIGHTNRTTGDIGSGSVLSFMATNRGTLLTGTWGDGIYQYDRSLKLLPLNIQGISEKQNPSVWSMFLSKDKNTIWMGAQPGIGRLNQAANTFSFINPPALMNRTVRQVAEDNQGHLWIGLQSAGLYYWHKNKGSVDFNAGISRFEEIPAQTINRISLDRNGLIWVACSQTGLYAIDPSTHQIKFRFHHEADPKFKLPEPGVSSVLDLDDSLTVITTGTHILTFNKITNTLRDITPNDGISGFVSSLEKDRQGYVWLSTSSALYRINVKRKIFLRFTQEDGVENDSYVLAASYALPDGRLVFGSNSEYVVLDPEHMLSHQLKPEVYITDFNVMNHSLRLDSIRNLDMVRLGSKANSVIIEFSTLRYAIAYPVRYMLEGLDKDWKYADPRTNQAIYTYLPGGTYTFRLQSGNEEGQFGNETLLRLRVTPPFWKSWWFFTGIVLLIAFVLYLLDRERMNRKRAMQEMRADISNNLHGEINTALSNINILSEMARLKAEKDPLKAEEYIEQIHNKSHNMIIAMDDMLWSLDPRNDNMKKTVERMQEYIEALNNRHGAYIDMIIDKNVEQLRLNMKLRHESFLLFKEGIHNLVQTGISICHIHLAQEKQQLVFTMQFDTESSDIQQLNNLFHRHDMEKRIDSMNAEMDVQVHKNSTMVVLKIPLS